MIEKKTVYKKKKILIVTLLIGHIVIFARRVTSIATRTLEIMLTLQ